MCSISPVNTLYYDKDEWGYGDKVLLYTFLTLALNGVKQLPLCSGQYTTKERIPPNG